MLFPSLFLVGMGQDKNALESLLTALMSLIASGLGLSGTWGAVFHPQPGIETSRHHTTKKRIERMVIGFSLLT
ncbi:MAG: hypothetical protein WC539_01595 [Nitrospirota bacterium]